MNKMLDEIKRLQSKVDNYYELKIEFKKLTFDFNSNVNSNHIIYVMRKRIEYIECEMYSAEDVKFGWLKPAEQELRNLKIDYLFEVEMKKLEKTEI